MKISFKDGALHYEQTSAKKRIAILGQAMAHRVSYADKNSKDEFLKFLKQAMKRAKISLMCCKISLLRQLEKMAVKR